jgi:hypothetical protein
LFGGYKITPYLCNRQNIEDYFSNEGKMISSPELIKLRWAYFYAHIADYCNEDMADAFQ